MEPEKDKSRKNKLILNVKYCEYGVIRDVAHALGYKTTERLKGDFDVKWLDLFCPPEVL